MTPEEKLLHKRLRRFLSKSTPCTFKSYKDMCDTLGIPYKAGNSKPVQLAHLQHFCNLTRQAGNAYSYSTVYADPDRNILEKTPLALAISEILLHEFLSSPDQSHELTLDTTHLWKLLGFVNQGYGFKDREKQFISLSNIDNLQLVNFKVRCKHRLDTLLESALNTLTKRNLITYEPIKIIFKNGLHDELFLSVAAPDEITRINNYEQQALTDFNCLTVGEIWAKGCESGYYHHFKNLIKKNEIANGWAFISNGFKIKCTDKTWLRSKTKKQIDIEEETKKINQLVIEAMQTNAENMLNNYINKTIISEEATDVVSSDALKTRGQKIVTAADKEDPVMARDYLYSQQILTDRFIRLSPSTVQHRKK